MQTDSSISIVNKTKGKLPSLPFVALKKEILGDKYELSISFVSPAMSRKFNFAYRGKDNPTNILSFELSKDSGELIIEPQRVKRDAPLFDMDFKNFLTFLVIHGMLHLKGMDHGAIMEKAEARFKKKFGVVEHTKSSKRSSR